MDIKTIYRVEHKYEFRGPCYSDNGQFQAQILRDGKKAVDIPMPHNEGYRESGGFIGLLLVKHWMTCLLGLTKIM